MLGLSIVSGVALRDWLARRTGLAIDPTPCRSGCRRSSISMSIPSSITGRTGWAIQMVLAAAPLSPFGEDFCVINGGRIHPAGFAGIFFINIPMPLLGATPEAMNLGQCRDLGAGF